MSDRERSDATRSGSRSREFRLLRDYPHFRRMWLASSFSQLGDWIGWVAVSVAMVRHGEGMWALALVFAAHHVPSSLVSGVAGRFVDRFDRRDALVVAVVAQGLLTVGMALASHRLGVLELLLVLRSAVMGVVGPVERAALPRLVPSHDLEAANALESLTWSVMLSAGMVLGGLVAGLGLELALWIDALTFLAAATWLVGLPRMPGASARRDDSIGWRAPLRWLAGMPRVAWAVLAKSPLALASGASWLLMHHWLAVEGTGTGFAIGLSLLLTLRGIGTGLGPLVHARVLAAWGSHQRDRLWAAAGWTTLGAQLAFVFAAASRQWWWAAVFVTLWGMGTGANWVISTARIQSATPDRFQGRVHALDGMTWMTAMTVGVAVAAVAVDFGLAGLLMALAVLSTSIWYVGHAWLRRVELAS